MNETDRGSGYYRDTVLSLNSTSQDDIRRTSIGGQAIWRSRFGTVLAAGYELEHQSIRTFDLSDAIGTIPHSDGARRNHAAYTQLSWQRSRVTLDGGVRMEHNERFGAAVTWKAGAVRRSSSARTRLRAEYFGDPGLPLEPGKPLLRRPKHTATATAIVRITEAAGLELGLRHTGEQMDLPRLNPRRRVMLPAYTVVDLAAEFQVAEARAGRPGFTLTVRAENLTGSEHEEAFGFAAPGRGVYVGGRMVVGGGG